MAHNLCTVLYVPRAKWWVKHGGVWSECVGKHSTCVTVSAIGHKEGEPSVASVCSYVSLRKLKTDSVVVWHYFWGHTVSVKRRENEGCKHIACLHGYINLSLRAQTFSWLSSTIGVPSLGKVEVYWPPENTCLPFFTIGSDLWQPVQTSHYCTLWTMQVAVKT